MSPVATHTEHIAARLEAQRAHCDIRDHGSTNASGPWHYASAADRVAEALADNPGTHTVTAIQANLAHPDSGRMPKPSAKAGRAALRALLSRQERRDHSTAANLIHQAAADVIANALHHASDAHDLDPDAVEVLHAARTGGAFPPDVSSDVRNLVCLVGDVIALAEAYGWAPESVLWAGRDTYDYEREAGAA
ncbi:hypothetical protein [Streptomyces chattanoogensis]|uniref:hypothetical protein n=1 Tax=Streptomyces chattanoogensis TaxID=66876 RepID=UPI0036CCFFF9